eukprot:6957941-Pyramimonas_sp.AAC.1
MESRLRDGCPAGKLCAEKDPRALSRLGVGGVGLDFGARSIRAFRSGAQAFRVQLTREYIGGESNSSVVECLNKGGMHRGRIKLFNGGMSE